MFSQIQLKQKITDAVVAKLKLKSKYELNDRYDGVTFLDKHLCRVLGTIKVQSEYNQDLWKPDQILKCKTSFIINSKTYKIVNLKADDYVIVDELNFDYIILTHTYDSYRKTKIIGEYSLSNIKPLIKNLVKPYRFKYDKLLNIN